MKTPSTSLLIASFVTLSGFGLSSCYTRLAGDKGDGWGYTGPVHREVIVRKESAPDTVIIQQKPAQTNIAAKEQIDTIYVDDNNVASTRYVDTHTTTVINNYYNDPYYDPWDSYWHRPRHAGISIYIGVGTYDPYYWPVTYHPYYSWYDPYPYWNRPGPYFYHTRYWGPGYAYYDPYYPYPPDPFYNCYAPVYSPDPYWYRGYGYGGYGYRGYGDGYDHDYGSRSHRNVKRGRINGGEQRAGTTAVPSSPGGIAVQGGGVDGMAVAGSDRSAPIHVVPPTVTGNAGSATGAVNTSAGSMQAGNGSLGDATADALPIERTSGSATGTTERGWVNVGVPSGTVSTNDIGSANSDASQNTAVRATPNASAPASTVTPRTPDNTTVTTGVSSATGRRTVVIHRSSPSAAPSAPSGSTGSSYGTSRNSGTTGTQRETPRSETPRAQPAVHESSRVESTRNSERTESRSRESSRSSSSDDSRSSGSSNSGRVEGGSHSTSRSR